MEVSEKESLSLQHSNSTISVANSSILSFLLKLIALSVDAELPFPGSARVSPSLEAGKSLD